MKFSSIVKGTRAERSVRVPLLSHEGGERSEYECIIRPLVAEEEAQAVAEARRYASAKGIPDPKRGDPIFDLGVMANTLAICCLDPDSPANDRQPFFDQGAEHLLANLGPEQIALLFQRWEAFQDECSPSLMKVDAETLWRMTNDIARSLDDDPFVRWPPFMRETWARITARQLLTLPEARSLYGLPSDTGGSSSANAPPTPTPAST